MEVPGRWEEVDVAAKLVWVGIGVLVLMIVGSMVISAIGALFKIVMYLAVGLLVVGGALVVVGKARHALRGAGRRELP